MSASERLRALGKRQRVYGWPGPPVRELFVALPLIADVVEAAENEVEAQGGEVLVMLVDALTALKEHLEGQ